MLTNVENIMNRTCDECESSKGNGNYKEIVDNHCKKKKDEILKTFNEKRRGGKFSTHKIC